MSNASDFFHSLRMAAEQGISRGSPVTRNASSPTVAASAAAGGGNGKDTRNITPWRVRVVIPLTVVAELKGHTRGGDCATRATSLLQFLDTTSKNSKKRSSPTGTGAADPTGTTTGWGTENLEEVLTVRYQAKNGEAYTRLLQFARNEDTVILACAAYFTHLASAGLVITADSSSKRNMAASDSSGAAGSGTDKSKATEPATARMRTKDGDLVEVQCLFVSEDNFMKVKAKPYNIRSMDLAGLQGEFGLRGHAYDDNTREFYKRPGAGR